MKNALATFPHLQDVSEYNLTHAPCGSVLELKYYPNPADHTLTLDLTNREPGSYVYYLYNEQGNIVKTENVSNRIVNISTSSLPEGIYFLHFYESEIPIIKQIFIQH